ncbi:amidohydrolase family protein [Microbacterium sp. 179-I 3D4 NHS]|uniref:amidohydrolase family protein n=1 Tax=Microbacterium sp. 179-I 3D4 NHS TaxID=3142381 RepID=UPI0039A13BDD
MRAATFFDGGKWREGALEVVEGRMLLRTDVATDGLARLDGVVSGGFTDHHVHLQLVDTSGLAGSALGRVVDLGANLAEIVRIAAAHRSSGTPAASAPSDSPAASEEERASAGRDGVRIEFAGAFLTAPGGYPTDRVWAPEGSFREIADPDEASAAVAEMADAGASAVKITSNTVAGPVFGTELFAAVVDLAAAHGLAVIVHAEGPGEAQRVVRLGAPRLAHAPFTERLDDDDIAEQAASASWISTLAVHDPDARAIAIDNVRRFHAAGGSVLYGTDMGNGPTPVDVSPAEIAALREAGVVGDALLRALDPLDPREPDAPLLLFPGASPATADPLRARRLTAADLKV